MQFIAITLFIFAGIAVSSAQTPCGETTVATCCDDLTCALAKCTEGEESATCVTKVSLADGDSKCYNKANECPADAPTANTTAAPPTPTADPTANVTNTTGSPATEDPGTAPTEPTEVSTQAAGPTGPTEAPSTSDAPTKDPSAPTDPPGTGTTDSPTEPTLNPPACNDGQTFDAASFIGGIVLAIGVMGIVFLGCKFFRAKSEQSYHQF
eukprot:GHVO01064208.1.p1 GENE.GHVO01064208.1~~GHVO01064208.1.p1  ORF type:complete len:210 (+),score=14.53 GHVO01064208.1:102-731(+)